MRPNIRYKTDIKGLDYGSGLADFFDPRFISQGVLVPKFATNKKFLNAFGKAIQGHHGITDIAKRQLVTIMGVLLIFIKL